MEKYEKVLELMKSKGGRLTVEDSDLLVILSRDEEQKKNLAYRLTTYMSYIRRFAKLEVKALRTGRKVWAYELIATGPNTYQSSKYVKEPFVDAPPLIDTLAEFTHESVE